MFSVVLTTCRHKLLVRSLERESRRCVVSIELVGDLELGMGKGGLAGLKQWK